MVKSHLVDRAAALFSCTGVRISAGGHPYLGAAIGQKSFVEDSITAKVSVWVKNWTSSVSAQTQPHTAFLAFTHGNISK